MSIFYTTTGQPISVRGDVATLAASLGAPNAELVLTHSNAISGASEGFGGGSSLTFQVTGTYVGTLTVEATVDGTTYIAIPHVAAATMLGAITTVSAATGFFKASVAGFSRVRVRMSAHSSGAAIVSAIVTFSDSSYCDNWASMPAVLGVTATAAVNTGVTLTLPAVAGLSHYITSISIYRMYSVVGIAAAAPNIVTTTNMPGSLAYNFGQAIIAAGSMEQFVLTPTLPIRSTVVGTATTFVCPAQLQTIWRVNASYYLGP